MSSVDDASLAGHSPRVSRLMGTDALAGWYLRWLGQRVDALDAATGELGGVLEARTDRLEATAASLAASVADLRRRLDELEPRVELAGPGPGPGPGGGGGER